MSRPLEVAALTALRERLLRGGAAPARVRRYLAELGDHLCDLIAEECEAGVPHAVAEGRALQRLGTTEALAQAMLGQRGVQSWSARVPIAAYVAAPLVLLWLSAALAMFALVAVYRFSTHGLLADMPPPTWLAPSLAAATQGVNLGVPVLIGWLLVRSADRQRARLLWPLSGIALLAAIGALVRLTMALPAIKGAPGEIDLAFDLFKEPRAVLAHAAINLVIVAAPYLTLRRWRAAHA